MSIDEYKFWRRETNKFDGHVGRFLKKKKKLRAGGQNQILSPLMKVAE